jgi:hypothetical protein
MVRHGDKISPELTYSGERKSGDHHGNCCVPDAAGFRRARKQSRFGPGKNPLKIICKMFRQELC